MTIRLATTEDLQQLCEHRFSFIKSLKKLDVSESTPQHILSFFEQFKSDTYHYLEKHLCDGTLQAFIAIENEQIVSSCLLCIYDLLPTPKNPSGKEGCLLNVYTLPAYRKQGFATALLTQALDYAKCNHIGLIHLSATDEGLPLYQKLGFILQEKELQWSPSICSLQ